MRKKGKILGYSILVLSLILLGVLFLGTMAIAGDIVEKVIVKESIAVKKAELATFINNSQISEIDCSEGTFHIYKENYIDKDIKIDCGALSDEDLKDLRNDLIENEIDAIEAVNSDRNAPSSAVTRLEEVTLIT